MRKSEALLAKSMQRKTGLWKIYKTVFQKDHGGCSSKRWTGGGRSGASPVPAFARHHCVSAARAYEQEEKLGIGDEPGTA